MTNLQSGSTLIWAGGSNAAEQAGLQGISKSVDVGKLKGKSSSVTVLFRAFSEHSGENVARKSVPTRLRTKSGLGHDKQGGKSGERGWQGRAWETAIEGGGDGRLSNQ